MEDDEGMRIGREEQENEVIPDSGTPVETRAEAQKETHAHKKTKKTEIEELREKLEAKEKEAAEHLDTLLRLKAEFENFRKALVKEQTTAVELASQRLIIELLPVLDSLERTIEAGGKTKDFEALLKGVELVYCQVLDVLTKEGLEAISPAGETFNPHVCEALMQEKSPEYEDNTVLEVFQKGYSLKGRVIRPARVKVSKK